MYSDELNIKQFTSRTEGMSREERKRAAEQELRDTDKLPYGRRKGATKTKDAKIVKYLSDLKFWLHENYYKPQ